MIDLDMAERMGIDAKRLKYPNAKSMEIVADALLRLVEETRLARAWLAAYDDSILPTQMDFSRQVARNHAITVARDVYRAALAKSEGGA